MNEAASYWSSVPHYPIFRSPATDTQKGYIISSLLCVFTALEKRHIHRLSANAKNGYSLCSILVALSNYRCMYYNDLCNYNASHLDEIAYQYA